MVDTHFTRLRDQVNLYPWPLLYRTLLLWYAFFTIGITDAVRGPTLLDLKDLIDVDVSDVSSIFAMRAFGGMVGCVLSGLLLDRISRSLRFLFIAGCLSVLTLCTLFLPYSPNLLAMQVLSVVTGVVNGGCHTGSNALLLNIWLDHNSSPYMYTMHFFFAAGGLIAPILAKPFLMEVPSSVEVDEVDLLAQVQQPSVWTVKTLYPIIAASMALSIPGFIYYFIKEFRAEKKTKSQGTQCKKEEKNQGPTISSCSKILLVGLMTGYYFTFAGVESCFRTFTSTFAVFSSLSMTRHEASDLLAIFFGAFAGCRALIIPLSTVVSPTLVLWTSLTTLIISTASLAMWGETSVLALQVGMALTGAGVASVFASGMLWVKNCMPVTNRVSAMFCLSCSVSTQLYAVVVGQYIENWPTLFLYLMTGSSVGLLLFFMMANIVGHNVRKKLTETVLKI